MNLRVLVVVGLLVAAAVVVVENVLFFRNRNQPPRVATAAVEEDPDTSGEYDVALPEVVDSVVPLPSMSRARLRTILLSTNGEPSPFLLGREREQSVMRRALGLPRLSGTFVGSGRRIAWIEGEPRRVGESFGEFTISRVEQGSVVIMRDGNGYTLQLESPDTPEAADDASGAPDVPDGVAP